MKNYTLIIICLFAYVGMYAQQQSSISKTEFTYVVNKIPNQNTTTVSRIDNLEYSLEEYESMLSRCQELTNKLVEYDKIIQNGSMTKKQTKAWKRDVMEAKLLGYRIEDFTAIYRDGDYPYVNYLNIQVLNNYDDFAKTLNDATQYAGF